MRGQFTELDEGQIRYMYVGDGIILVEGSLEEVQEHVADIKDAIRQGYEKQCGLSIRREEGIGLFSRNQEDSTRAMVSRLSRNTRCKVP